MHNTANETFQAWPTIISSADPIMIDYLGYNDDGDFLAILEIGSNIALRKVQVRIGGLSYVKLSPESFVEHYWGLELGSTFMVENSSWLREVAERNPLFIEEKREVKHWVIMCDDFAIDILSNSPVCIELCNESLVDRD